MNGWSFLSRVGRCLRARTPSRLLLLSLWALALCAWSLAARSYAGEEPELVLDHQRILLGDLVSGLAPRLAEFDLGPAPMPGRSRWLSRDDVRKRLQQAGIPSGKLQLPEGVRVSSATKQFSPEELEALVTPAIRQQLPEGAELRRLTVQTALTLSPQVRLGTVRVPELVERSGAQSQTATVELLWGDQLLQRLPVSLVVWNSAPQQLRVERGSPVTLSIRKGSVEISALGETLGSAKVGEMVQVRILVTKRLVSARLVSTSHAELLILN